MPGWKETITEEPYFLYDIIVEFLGMDENEEERIAWKLREKHDYDAVVYTTGFTLKALKIKVKERDNRVKFIVFSKVSED